MQKIPCLRSGGDTVQKHPQEVTCEYDPCVSLKLEKLERLCQGGDPV